MVSAVPVRESPDALECPDDLERAADAGQLVTANLPAGADVLKAVALGAVGVLPGRPALWSPAAGGAAGAGKVLSRLGEEFRHALTLAGCPDLARARLLRTVTIRQE
ncbi:MAG TPA: alpha-hydroxy-acid oxidizing protein [Streptosporangiaceae bacterium]|nr:alpha-hydroxy-acid oxidizing protein [Streptosporangiaceae bacterium]